LAEILLPLTDLLKSNIKWKWESSQIDAFETVKKLLASKPILKPYDPNSEVTLTCDASGHAIGASLEQNGYPVIFISKKLSPAEVNYAQIDREALALVWATQRLRKYLLGRSFNLVTDHKPLIYIFDNKAQVNKTQSARLQRWALQISEFNYKINFRSSKEIPVADCLSRLNGINSESHYDNMAVLNVNVNCFQSLKSLMCREPYNKVVKVIKNGGSQTEIKFCEDKLGHEIDKFALNEHGFILFQDRIFIPFQLRDIVLKELHDGHQGIDKTKSYARQIVWWPSINRDIENFVNSCPQCLEFKRKGSKGKLISWPEATYRLERVHIDICGPINNQYLFVIVDAYSK